MTRVVFTVTNDLSYDQRMQRICSSLQAAGYDPLLVGFVKDRSVALRDKPYRQKRINLFFRKGKLFFIEYNLRLFFYLLFCRTDIICSIDLDTLSAGWAAARLRRKKLVFDAHEYYTELPEVVGRRFVGGFWRWLEAFLLPKVRHNYTVSQSIADELQQRYGQEYAVFPNYPMLREQKATVSSPEPGRLLYQGALNKGRGLEGAMEAMNRIAGELRIAGEGDLSDELRALGQEFNQRPDSKGRVKFLGYLEPETLQNETAASWLGLNLLENIGKSYFYSLSNKFFDYIHAGLPQLSMDFPEYRRINEQYQIGLLLPDTNPEKLATAVNRLIEQPDEWAKLRQNCLRAREELCWQKLEPALVAFYDQLGQD